MKDRLRNKVAIVFGAGSSGLGWGNGQASASLLAANGEIVIRLDINLTAAGQMADILTCEGGHASAYAFDVTDPAAISNLR
ncbi:NAD(P)-dependent dehydrogenase (short-subunit alcohol dehydrogenase family) [Skermanella aerolata]|uniref:hypothetical protein n=1 Tax=Skermanella aerolata TaxID=393310 RepID=UPI003D238F4E